MYEGDTILGRLEDQHIEFILLKTIGSWKTAVTLASERQDRKRKRVSMRLRLADNNFLIVNQ
jgi:hypothetical protein